ncbi:MAG: hypothetical protein AAGN64_16005 [Bacteroidota bacterium]
MLLDLATIKERFPSWVRFVQPEDDETADEALTRAVEAAERDFARFLTVASSDDLTDVTEHYLMVFVRKHSFDQLHAETVFESRPQIYRDYDLATKELASVRDGGGQLSAPTPSEAGAGDLPHFESKPRRFDTWFRD